MNKKFFSIVLLVSMIAIVSNVQASSETKIASERVSTTVSTSTPAKDATSVASKEVVKTSVTTKENIVARGYNATKGALVSAKTSVVSTFNTGLDKVKKSTPVVKGKAAGEQIYHAVAATHPALLAAGTAVLAFAILYSFNIKNFRNFVNRNVAKLKPVKVAPKAVVVAPVLEVAPVAKVLEVA